MTRYLLELGVEEKTTEGKAFHSRGFYADYTVNGPVIVEGTANAYAFPTYEHAQNVQQGDERLRPSRIVKIESSSEGRGHA